MVERERAEILEIRATAEFEICATAREKWVAPKSRLLPPYSRIIQQTTTTGAAQQQSLQWQQQERHNSESCGDVELKTTSSRLPAASSQVSTMAEPRSRVLVDPETGNVLIVHRRSIGTGTILFFLALVSLIAAKYVDDGNWREAFYSFGALCCTLLMCVLIWRCCCCCCHPKHRTPGYVVVGGPQSQAGVVIPQQVNVTPNPAYPVAPAVQPVLASYPTPGVGTFAAPPFVAGITAQPAYNPNMPPAAQVQQPQQHLLQQQQGVLQQDHASAPPCDAPPTYDEATAIPHKQ